MSRPASRCGGSGSRRTATTTPSASAPTSSRASDSAPGPSSWPAARMPTKADAHSATVISAAASGRDGERRITAVTVGAQRRGAAGCEGARRVGSPAMSLARTPMTFAGFPAATFVWFAGLEADNSRPWFHAHRETYDSVVRGALEALLDELAAEVGGEVKVFRQHRDVRFSRDKSPYKTRTYGLIFDRPGT